MSSIPRDALNTSASKPGMIGGLELDAQRLRARDHFLRIGDVGRRDLVHHLRGRVAQHPLGADIEDLDDALRVRGDAREVGAVEDRALQGPGLQQYLFGLLSRRAIGALGGVHRQPRRVDAVCHDIALVTVVISPPGQETASLRANQVLS